MFKIAFVLTVLIACTAAKSGVLAAILLTYSTDGVVGTAPAPVVTATSSQVIARNNGIAAAPSVATTPVAALLVTRFAAAAALPTQLTAPHYVAPFAAASLFW
ncbi:uncharacterized protein LOC125778636 isoform X2 [Bactrocera dorsalis]|uniref:Uncharacterized protein LOC125778636 isoform X2 n=1 Tax=Bactrocera dorsalis TaxID=27457 RepID=A0ABM3JVM9_BACDO|nr:uncharacterized protein LOC125778636 isoform X2 [Bactrocera dorsalis]